MDFKLTLYFLVTVLFISCGKSTEVTIVDDTSGVLPSENTQSQRDRTIIQDNFTVIKIGETNPIQTMDPLFATTSSEFRAHSLIYDGLTQLSDEGNIEGAIAKKWTVTRDSLRYTFTLRDNVFYHNNTRFTSGVGRQVSPKDIVMNFERMASILVPDNAAEMFSGIQGFDSFHTEQTYIKIPSNRSIKSIDGISISNDSTLVFVLTKKDPKFLEKLAHPYASIYAGESLPANKTPIYEPIGTGGYYLAQRRNNLFILASNDDYFQEQSVPTRIDITHGKKESDIYQDFAKGELDALIEIGPGTIVQVTDSSGMISPIFQSVFKVNEPSVYNEINFYYNPASNNSDVYSFLSNQKNSFLNFEKSLGEVTVKSRTQASDTLKKSTVYVAYTKNPAEIYFIDAIAEKFSSTGINVVMNSSYAVTDDISFSATNFPEAQQTIIWKQPIYILSKQSVSGITISQKPWNISFEGAKITKGN